MALSQENILGSFLPTVNISKILLNTTRVDLEMAIIDTNFDDSIFSIINDKFLRDCIIIKVFQSLDPETTDKLSEGQQIGNSLEVPITSNTKLETDQEGNRILYYSVSFDLETSNLKHLSYVVFSEIDLRALRNSFSIVLTQDELNDVPKKINVDTVIDNSQVVSTSYIYELSDGTIWNGEVINVNGIFQTLEDIPRILTEIEIPNYKIQDFRLRNIVQKNSVSEDFEKYSDLLLEDTFIPQSNLDISVSKPKVFENISKTVNFDGSVSVSILMNMSELIKQNCLFPKVIKNSLTNERLLIFNMSLYRRQIKSTINNDGKNIIELEENKEPELIINNFKNYIIDVEPNTKHFLLKDEKIKYITNGKYQYGIRINFIDPSISELKRRLITALSIRKNMVEYSKFCETFTDSNTNYFKKEVVETWEPAEIDRQAESYVAIDFNLPEDSENFNKVNFLSNLKSNISPINGTIEGIYIFLKIIDDLIQDISSLLSITNSLSDIYQFKRNDVNEYSTKSSSEIFYYFNEAIYDAEEYSNLQMNYLNIVNGIVSSNEFVDSIFPSTQTSDVIYVAPKSFLFRNELINLSLFEKETNESVKKEKYSLLQNKIFRSQKIKDFINDSESFQFLNNFISDKLNVVSSMKNYNNLLLKNTISELDSLIIENSPPLSRDFDKFNSINKILNPEEVILISENQTEVNMLKNLTINLNDQEQRFKFLMLSKVEYLEKNQNTQLFNWNPLTLNKINEFINQERFNVLCRLMPYDYSSINYQIKNINNFTYNQQFLLNLRNFSFTQRREQSNFQTVVQASAVENITQVISGEIQSVSITPTQSTTPESTVSNTQTSRNRLGENIIPRPIRRILEETQKDQKQQTNNLFKDIIPFSKKQKNTVSRTNVTVSKTKTNKNKNFSTITNRKNKLNNR